jgi:hypothetical protein
MMVLVIKCRFSDAATVLLRWGLAADKSKAVHTQCKVVPRHEYHTVACKAQLDFLTNGFYVQAYLSAIIVYLYAHDLKQADQCYNDCSQ